MGKVYKCNQCDDLSLSYNELVQHKRTEHRSDHPCHVCGKLFSRVDVLKRHEKTHTDDPDYACPLCLKHFTRPSNMRQQIQAVHNSDKKRCLHCDKEYVYAKNLERHIQREHTSNPPPPRYVTCRTCGEKFRTRSGMLRHQLMEHQTNGGLQPSPYDNTGMSLSNFKIQMF